MASVFQPMYTKCGPDGSRVSGRIRVWWIEYSDPRLGRRVRVRGSKDETTARSMAAELERRANAVPEGAARLSEHKAGKITLEAHVAAYEDHLKNKNVSVEHLVGTLHRLKAMIKATGCTRLDGFRSADIRLFLDGLRKDGAGARTRNIYLSSAKAFFNWALSLNLMSVDPTATIRKVQECRDIRRSRRALTETEFTKLLEVAKMDSAERALVYKLAAYTGLRRGELRQLRWHDFKIGCNKPLIIIGKFNSKSDRRQWLPIWADLEADLLAWRKISKRVNGSDPVVRVPVNTAKRMKGDLAAAGIEYKIEDSKQADFDGLRRYMPIHRFGQLPPYCGCASRSV